MLCRSQPLSGLLDTVNNTFATSPTIGDQRDFAFYRPAAARLANSDDVRAGIPSWVWRSALHRSGQRARAAAYD